MAGITSVKETPQTGMAGMISESAYNKIDTYNNSSVQIDTITITAADKLTSVDIGTANYTVNSASGSETIANLASALATAINAGETDLVAVAGSATVTLTGNDPGDSWTVTASANTTITNVVEPGASANVGWGLFVSKDKNSPTFAHLPQDASAITTVLNVGGFTIRDLQNENDETTNTGYAAYEQFSTLRTGRIWCQKDPGVAITTIQSVYVRYTVSGTKAVGMVSGTSDSGKNAVLANARFVYNAAAADTVALVEILA